MKTVWDSFPYGFVCMPEILPPSGFNAKIDCYIFRTGASFRERKSRYMGIDDICTVSYTEETGLVILDQTKLPNEEVYVRLETKESVWDAIRKLMVRGAPAIGVCAGYGLAVSMERDDSRDIETFRRHVRETAAYLNSSRPTAVNLSWALERLCSRLDRYLQNPSENAGGSTGAAEGMRAEEKTAEGMRNAGAGIFCPDVSGAKRVLFDEAEKIRREDEAACRKMGEFGLALLKPGMGILTHCNAGTLATAKYGTCLSPIYVGQERGYDFRVFADETRPLLQGARLTSWELMKAGVDVTLICDNMANQVMKNGWIDAVVVGCDRMAANGDGANKIGTSGVAVLAKEYGIPFYMFVPTSTIDLETKTGEDIVIEQRDGEEIGSMWYQRPMAPAGVKKYNPAFDVTPSRYITAVVTEKGIVRPPYEENLRKIMEDEL